MEQEFHVAIDIDIEYEVGSPPTEDYDPYVIAHPDFGHYESLWMSREGPDEGDITTATTALYPNFQDATRRQIFCIAMFGGSSTTVTWNGVAFPVGKLWLNTDPSWTAAGQAIASAGEGVWFACEGELEEDYREWKPAISEPFSL